MTNEKLPAPRGTSGKRTLAVHVLCKPHARLAACAASVLLVSTALIAPARAANRNWSGAVSSDWFTAGNWSGGAVPTAADQVNIDSPNQSVINGAAATASSISVGVNTSNGNLLIQNGGVLTSAWWDNNYIGYNAGSTGSVTVTGAGSKWDAGFFLQVGEYGNGTLTVAQGGQVSSEFSYIGDNAGAIGTVTVSGAGSRLNVNGQLLIGEYGNGTLTVEQGGQVNSGSSYIGDNAGAIGTATVTGAGSKWDLNNSAFRIGRYGTGTLTVADSGSVSAGGTSIGDEDGGHGTLRILNGGVVNSSSYGIIGWSDGSTGSVTVSGTGSQWNISGDLSVGHSGLGTLTVEQGGQVNSVDGYISRYGTTSSGSSATVTGAGSQWNLSGNLYVGDREPGTLTVADGGHVSSVDGSIGGLSGGGERGLGTATVTGAGSQWTNSGSLTIGRGGDGALTIANDGVVTANGPVTIAKYAGSTGTLNIGGAAGSPATAAGTLNAASGVQFGSGTGEINFNHTDANYTFAPSISGFGTINQIAGNTNLIADSSGFTGPTFIIGGQLAVNGSLAGSVVTAMSGTVLSGAGTVGGVVLQSGSTIAPGNNGLGTLTVVNNFQQLGGSTYAVEVVPGAATSDLIKVGGTATIGAGSVLDVSKAGAGNYTINSVYKVLTADGGVTGTYIVTGDTRISTFYSLVGDYDANNVYLRAMQTRAFTDAAWTPNQTSTAGGLDSLPGGNGLHDAVGSLQTDAEARDAFDQLSGEIHASIKGALIDDSRFVRNASIDRVRAAFDCYEGERRRIITKTEPRRPEQCESRAVWMQGFGAWGYTNSDGNAARLSHDIGGFLIGADTPVFDTWRVGLLGGYSSSTYGVPDRHSSGSSDNYTLGIYGGTQWDNLGLRLGAAQTWSNITTGRNVAFAGFTDRLTGDYSAGTTQVFGDLGYRIRVGSTSFEPFAGLAYVNVNTDGFTEKGGLAALTSQDSNTGVTFSTLGLRANSNFTLGNVGLTASGTLGWRHAWGDTTPTAIFNFDGSAPFSIAGVPIATDAAVVEAGLTANVNSNVALGAFYQGQFGDAMQSQGVRGNLSVKF